MEAFAWASGADGRVLVVDMNILTDGFLSGGDYDPSACVIDMSMSALSVGSDAGHAAGGKQPYCGTLDWHLGKLGLPDDNVSGTPASTATAQTPRVNGILNTACLGHPPTSLIKCRKLVARLLQNPTMKWLG